MEESISLYRLVMCDLRRASLCTLVKSEGVPGFTGIPENVTPVSSVGYELMSRDVGFCEGGDRTIMLP